MLDRERLSAITDNVVYDEPMSKHTTFRIGGTADAFVSPENALEIEKIIHFCKDTDTPYMLMGNGSNMLVGDGGIRGVVIHIGNGMSKCRIEGEERTSPQHRADGRKNCCQNDDCKQQR